MIVDYDISTKAVFILLLKRLMENTIIGSLALQSYNGTYT